MHFCVQCITPQRPLHRIELWIPASCTNIQCTCYVLLFDRFELFEHATWDVLLHKPAQWIFRWSTHSSSRTIINCWIPMTDEFLKLWNFWYFCNTYYILSYRFLEHYCWYTCSSMHTCPVSDLHQHVQLICILQLQLDIIASVFCLRTDLLNILYGELFVIVKSASMACHNDGDQKVVR